jgi:hypothetical protein
MASELAANTLHAQAVAEAGGGGHRLASVKADVEGEPVQAAGPAPRGPKSHRHRASGVPGPRIPQAVLSSRAPQAEIWLYLRGVGTERELVCKVFDCCRGWRDGEAPSVAAIPGDAIGGRGLRIVDELSRGRWGHHVTRARLNRRGLRGKAVWFAVPAPLAHARLVDVTGLHEYTLSADISAERASGQLSARQASRELQSMLDGRGFASGLVRDDEPDRDLSIVSVRRGLTVWCHSGTVSLTTPWGSSQEWGYADLIEAAEQTVRRSEELDLEQDLSGGQ